MMSERAVWLKAMEIVQAHGAMGAAPIVDSILAPWATPVDFLKVIKEYLSSIIDAIDDGLQARRSNEVIIFNDLI